MAQKDGTLFVIGNACYLKYYTIAADGERKRNTVRLCSKSDVYDWSSKKRKGSDSRTWSYSRPVIELQRETMAKIKAAIPDTSSTDMKIVDFWPLYLKHYSEDIVPLTGTHADANLHHSRIQTDLEAASQGSLRQHDSPRVHAGSRDELPQQSRWYAGQEYVEAHSGIDECHLHVRDS